MPHFYIVATPLGNLADITHRALETLRSVDVIAAEDTRVTAKLLAAFEIRKPMVSYHQHSTGVRTKEILDLLRAGKSVALVTDAGTPGISDPGGKLVEEVVRVLPSLPIIPIPGPCALAATLSISGFPCDEFIFLGFPPNKKGRKKFFERLSTIPSTVVFYESTHRILKTMDELGRIGPIRPLVVCRELTKLHETIYRGTAVQVTEQLKKSSIRGEFVIVIGPLNSKSEYRPPKADPPLAENPKQIRNQKFESLKRFTDSHIQI